MFVRVTDAVFHRDAAIMAAIMFLVQAVPPLTGSLSRVLKQPT
jgi:hypothetical protein